MVPRLVNKIGCPVLICINPANCIAGLGTIRAHVMDAIGSIASTIGGVNGPSLLPCCSSCQPIPSALLLRHCIPSLCPLHLQPSEFVHQHQQRIRNAEHDL